VGATAWSASNHPRQGGNLQAEECVGAAWTLSKRGEPINVVRNWSQSEIADKVPSAYTYSSNPGTQWGGDIGPGAVILKWTKMQLEPPPLLDALQQLRLSLENATQAEIGPRKIVQRPIAGHDLRAPWETMTSYLVEVAKMVRQDIVRVKDELTLSHSPIDLIITHPGVGGPHPAEPCGSMLTQAIRSGTRGPRTSSSGRHMKPLGPPFRSSKPARAALSAS